MDDSEAIRNSNVLHVKTRLVALDYSPQESISHNEKHTIHDFTYAKIFKEKPRK